MHELMVEINEKLINISERVFLWINLAFATLILLLHGIPLWITFIRDVDDGEMIRQLALFSLPLTSVVIITAIIGLYRERLSTSMLKIQGSILAISGMFILIWALDLIINGIKAQHFSWQLGFMTAWITYSTLVFCRSCFSEHLRDKVMVLYTTAGVGVLAMAIDVAVFVKMFAQFDQMFLR